MTTIQCLTDTQHIANRKCPDHRQLLGLHHLVASNLVVVLLLRSHAVVLCKGSADIPEHGPLLHCVLVRASASVNEGLMIELISNIYIYYEDDVKYPRPHINADPSAYAGVSE